MPNWKKLITSGSDAALNSLEITQDLTVDTNTLYVDSTNNRVGIGTTSPSQKLAVVGAGTTNATSTAKFQDSSLNDVFSIQDDGELQISTAKYSNDGVLTNNGGIVTEIVGWSGIININQPAPDPPIQIQVDKGIIVNVT